jgi:hypothetical protein
VSAVLARIGLGRLSRLEPVEAASRYEKRAGRARTHRREEARPDRAGATCRAMSSSVSSAWVAVRAGCHRSFPAVSSSLQPPRPPLLVTRCRKPWLPSWADRPSVAGWRPSWRRFLQQRTDYRSPPLRHSTWRVAGCGRFRVHDPPLAGGLSLLTRAASKRACTDLSLVP